MNKHFIAATTLSLPLLLGGCAENPDSKNTKETITAQAKARGGVCMDETFTVMFGERSYGIVKPIKTERNAATDTKTTTLNVQTHTPSKRWLLVFRQTGNSDFESDVKIENFPLKSEKQCEYIP
ncbi:MAG: hypothetical protein R3E13_05225 [Alphaproteobacteria bacterium]